MSKSFLLVLLLNVLSYSAILHWHDTLPLNTSIAFGKQIGLPQLYNKASIGSDSVLNCGNHFTVYSRPDFYFYGEKLFTCICFVDVFAIGSSQPFFVSKVAFDSIDFTTSLDLNDTAIFSLIDTIRNDPEEPSQCVRPHIHAGAVDSTCYPKFMVINTRSGYVLITYRDLWVRYQNEQGLTIEFYNKIVIDAYLQDDKSLNFSEILQLETSVKPAIKSLKVNASNKPLYYDLKGKVISNPAKKQGVLINGGKRLLFVR